MTAIAEKGGCKSASPPIAISAQVTYDHRVVWVKEHSHPFTSVLHSSLSSVKSTETLAYCPVSQVISRSAGAMEPSWPCTQSPFGAGPSWADVTAGMDKGAHGHSRAMTPGGAAAGAVANETNLLDLQRDEEDVASVPAIRQ